MNFNNHKFIFEKKKKETFIMLNCAEQQNIDEAMYIYVNIFQ